MTAVAGTSAPRGFVFKLFAGDDDDRDPPDKSAVLDAYSLHNNTNLQYDQREKKADIMKCNSFCIARSEKKIVTKEKTTTNNSHSS